MPATTHCCTLLNEAEALEMVGGASDFMQQSHIAGRHCKLKVELKWLFW